MMFERFMILHSNATRTLTCYEIVYQMNYNIYLYQVNFSSYLYKNLNYMVTHKSEWYQETLGSNRF